MSHSHTAGDWRIDQIAHAWARDNSLRNLRSRKRRNFKRAGGELHSITKAEAWKALKRAIAIKREALTDEQVRS